MRLERKKNDRRVERTQHSLTHALIELIQEKPFDAITVQNVIDRADVGRATFYAHYEDKDHLFLSSWKRLLDWFISQIEWENAKDGRFIPVRELFSHVQESYPFYKALAKSRKTDLIFKTGLTYLTESIEKALRSSLKDKPQPSVPLPILSNYIASEVLSLLRWWADRNMPYPPEQMDDVFHDLVAPGFRSILHREEAWGNSSLPPDAQS